MQNKIDALLYGWGAFMFFLMHMVTEAGAGAYVLTGIIAGVLVGCAVISWIASHFE